MNRVFAELPTTVFERMSRLAREHGAVNLGQGFPDDPGPEDVREAAARALMDGPNQYPPMMGLPALREAIAAHYARHQGLTLDPDTEVMVTSGATEALAGALLALIEPGDEVVLFAPMYDAYLPLVLRAGGVPRIVNLLPPAFRLDEAALSEAFSDRTKLVLLNNPLNPSATLFGHEDLALLARFCRAHDVIALRRGVGARRVRRGPPSAADGPARHARADGEDRLGGQDLLADRLEGRLRHRRCAADAGARQGASVPDLHHTAQPASRRCPGPRQGRGVVRSDARGLCPLAGSPRGGVEAARLHGAPRRRDVVPQHRHRAARPPRRRRLLRGAGHPARGGCDPGERLLPGEPVRHIVRLCFAKADPTLDAALDRMSGLARAAA